MFILSLYAKIWRAFTSNNSKSIFMKQFIFILSLTALLFSCGQKDKKPTANEKPAIDSTVKTTPITFCSGEGLSLIDGGSEGLMGGSSLISYLFINTSSTPCTLSGYPSVELLNNAKKPTAGVSTSNSTTPYSSGTDTAALDVPPVIMLAPNDTAFFQIRVYSGVNNDPKPKVQGTAYVKVKVPNTTREFILAGKFDAYGDVSVSYLQKGLPQ